MSNQNTIPGDLLKTLQETIEFRAHLILLKELSKYTAIAVVSADTPFGADFSVEDAKAVNDIGFDFDFSNSFQHSLAGMIHKGKLIFGRISEDIIRETIDFGTVAVQIWSSNFNNAGIDAGVIIDEMGIKTLSRGLTFYVLSIPEKKIIDAATFDTYEKEIKKQQLSPIDKPIMKFSEEHKEFAVIGLKSPWLDIIPPAFQTENEKFIMDNEIDLNTSVEKSILKSFYPDLDDLKNVVTPPTSYHDIFGVKKFFNFESKYVNCKNGIRVTPGVPETYKRAIYTGGGCGSFGVGAKDSGTIAAYLQKILNEKCPELGFAVFNYGHYLCEQKTCRQGDEIRILEFLPAKPGDIIITSYEYGMNDYVDLSNIERPYKYGDIFFDNIHLTEAGYHEAADLIFENLLSNDFYTDKTAENTPLADNPRRDKLNINDDEAAQLKAYTDMLDNVAGLLKLTPADNIGAVVMNCNPFTNGHRYLIETAAAKVKYLFVFAVQEDRSEFPFEERYELMQAATEDIENVYVLPSGQFIISSFTFEEYFNKKSLNTMAVNPSNDIRLFGGQIAPHLNIKTRFAGEEPLDPVTRQYNRQMEAILPQYGVSFEEIPRKEIDGEVISASRVRELLKTRDFEAIARLVPTVTLEYLKRKYK
jgi:[citrate (pro-3S)-lyase] ligase